MLQEQVDRERVLWLPAAHLRHPQQPMLEREPAALDPTIDAGHEGIQSRAFLCGGIVVQAGSVAVEAEKTVPAVDIQRVAVAHARVAEQRRQLAPRHVPEQVELEHPVARHQIALGQHGIALGLRGDAP